jgi:hypothetical protein
MKRVLQTYDNLHEEEGDVYGQQGDDSSLTFHF